jgi:hypothetical protein
MVPEPFPKSVEGHAHLETFGLQRPTCDPERASASPGDLGVSENMMIDFSGLFGVDWNLHEALASGLGSTHDGPDWWLTAPMDDLLHVRASPNELT